VYDKYSRPISEFEIRRLPISELRSSMILEEDMLTLDGKFRILQKGTTLNQTWWSGCTISRRHAE